MPKTYVIGLDGQELEWVRLLMDLLRHPDPVVGEVTREALGYLQGVAARADDSRAAS
jgi:hypothetical protein